MTVPPTAKISDRPQLPDGYELIAELAWREGVWVVRAKSAAPAGREVVCRIDTSQSTLENRRELVVLGGVHDAGILGLIDHGVTGEGHPFGTRPWVDGLDLSGWARERNDKEIGAKLVALCCSLETLHQAGLAHADLKPENVLVGNDGCVYLCDFGLTISKGEQHVGLSGTPIYLAPELLLGGTADARTDLFALGVLMHRLLVGNWPSTREFYGRFPGESFFAVTGSKPESLPEWARDITAELLARDPDARPESAASVARHIAGRLGMKATVSGADSLRFGIREGRTPWFEQTVAELVLRARSTAATRPVWIQTHSEDALDVYRALRLDASLEGVRGMGIELGVFLRGIRDGTQLDEALRGLMERRRAGALTAVLASNTEPWAMRALSSLSRGGGNRNSEGALLIVAPGPPPSDDHLFDVQEISKLTEGALLEFLVSRIADEEPGRLKEFATLLTRSGEDSAVRITRLLTRCSDVGSLLFGGQKPALRPGVLPREIVLGDEESSQVQDVELQPLLAALEVMGKGTTLTGLVALTGMEPTRAATELTGLVRMGSVLVERTEDELWVESQRGVRGTGGLTAEDWRRLHRRCLDDLPHSALSDSERAFHAWCADPSTESETALVFEFDELIDSGCAELGVDLVQRIELAAPRVGVTFGARWAAQAAFCWLALGQTERALAAVQDFEGSAENTTQALIERVKARAAALRHENDEALERFERAMVLDPSQWVDACVAKIYLLHSLGRDKQVVQQVAAAVEGARQVPTRQAVYLRSMRAMSEYRLGQIDKAHHELESLLISARGEKDPGREAALSIDLAIVERRAGSLERAADYLDSAVRLYGKAGNITGQAHALGTLGGTLRELGRLTEAEESLVLALETRERSGDERGAAAARGMLGLVAADRGRPLAALEELRRGADTLSDAQKRLFAPLLLAKAAEVSARIGAERQVGGDGMRARDPRVLLALAREAALRGHQSEALQSAESAQAQAMSLSQRAAEVEARYLASLFGGSPHGSLDGASPLVQSDAAIFELIKNTDTFDVERGHELAASMQQSGRDDRAARLWIAVAQHSEGAVKRRRARDLANAAMDRCCRGLSPAESRQFRSCLLGVPDPCPDELIDFEVGTRDAGENEMEMMTLLEINHRLVAQEDLPTLLGVIVESALSVSGAERGFLVLEEGGELRLDTALDSCRGDMDAPEFEFSRSVVGEALARMEPVRVSNAQDDPMLGSAPSVVSLELRSVLCAPFVVDEQTRGAIYVDHRIREGAFSEDGARLLSLLGDQAALAIQQVSRLEEIRRLNQALKGEVVSVESQLKTAQRALQEAGLAKSTAGLVGNSSIMREVHGLIDKAAGSDLPALVTGESGTGKELAARGLHELSSRNGRPFVCENCAALPASLIESELFGYKRGAFTGADRDRAGMFERTAGGTLFLDEIGEIPIDLQAKLLRVLETSTVRRLGDSETRSVDFRLVTATNKNLELEIQEGRFRADLFYRIDGLRVEMPPLRDRTEDLPALIDHFLRREGAKSGRVQVITPEVVTRLCRRQWPGNVRELSNEIARLCVLSDEEINDPALVRDPGLASTPDRPGPPRTLADLERDAILDAIARAEGDKAEAAKQLGISRSKIYQRLKEWDGTEGGGLGD